MASIKSLIINLRDGATAVGLLCLLVEHFGLRAEIITPLYKAVQLNTTFQDGVNGFVKDLGSLIEVLLNLC